MFEKLLIVWVCVGNCFYFDFTKWDMFLIKLLIFKTYVIGRFTGKEMQLRTSGNFPIEIDNGAKISEMVWLQTIKQDMVDL